jgi:hypothetical protein
MHKVLKAAMRKVSEVTVSPDLIAALCAARGNGGGLTMVRPNAWAAPSHDACSYPSDVIGGLIDLGLMTRVGGHSVVLTESGRRCSKIRGA